MAANAANVKQKTEADDPNVVTEKELQELKDKIQYSDKYHDDKYEYRHVILPKMLYKLIPQEFLNPDKSGTLRLLSEPEWRAIGISQSMGWVHYEVHTPEPHVLLFRRSLDFAQQVQQTQPHARNPLAPARRKHRAN